MDLKELTDRKNSGDNLSFEFFFRSRSPFSQWYISQFKVDGIKYWCMEQYMMAEKARLFKDSESLNKILSETKSQKNIKALGRRVKNFDDKVWNKNKLDIVYKGNKAKFSQNKELYNILISTGDKILVEANPWDRIWGIGMSCDDANATDPRRWKGENLLGFTLMKVRLDLLNSRVVEN